MIDVSKIFQFVIEYYNNILSLSRLFFFFFSGRDFEILISNQLNFSISRKAYIIQIIYTNHYN